jgi:hypothetical protein
MVRGLGFEEFRDSEGRLYTPAGTPQWEQPRDVKLMAAGINGGMNAAQAFLWRYGSELHIETSRHDSFKDLRPARIAPATPELLEKFIGLAKASDRQIQRFATKYGGLEVFFTLGSRKSEPVHIEYCEVWRYFARVMATMLKIGSHIRAGEQVPTAEWHIIAQTPEAVHSEGDDIHGHRLRDSLVETAEWCSNATYVRLPGCPHISETRAVFLRLLNNLLGLGMVRPWIKWPSTRSQPQFVYSGHSLLSSLALQLCLNVIRIDSLVICTGCQEPYKPEKRAPKAGQRNFCPKCRKKRIPQRYAQREFLAKRRTELGSKD